MKLEQEPEKEAEGGHPVTTLWLVDDNADYRQMLADLFSRDSNIHCARQFESAEAVLQALETEAAPDVILSDVRMGGMSGADSVAPIKRLAPRTNVVLLSTMYDSVVAKTAQRAGASGFLLKWYEFSQISEYIQKLGPRPCLSLVSANVRQEFATPPPSSLTPSSAALASPKPSRWSCGIVRQLLGVLAFPTKQPSRLFPPNLGQQRTAKNKGNNSLHCGAR